MSTVAEFNQADNSTSLLGVLSPIASAWKGLLAISFLAGVVAYGATFLVSPTFTARTVFLPPQQQQSAAASALAQLGALSGLTGSAASARNSADQYIALMQSNAVLDRLVDHFGLLALYESKYRIDARRDLQKNTLITGGKKDGLITVLVDDRDPTRAADIANQFVEELRLLTNRLALSEAQQRRAFFESQMQTTRDRLTQAQVALQASGFNTGALRAEPRAAAEGYARLRAEVTSAEVRLSTLRSSLMQDTPEVRTQQATLSALRAQLSRLEANVDTAAPNSSNPDYIGKYREFKYQETLFDLFSKQYEIARLDEAREGSLIQVIDVATPPERKSKPQRALVSVATATGIALVMMGLLVIRYFVRRRQTH